MWDTIENSIAVAYELFDAGLEDEAKLAMVRISKATRLYGDKALMRLVESHLTWFAA